SSSNPAVATIGLGTGVFSALTPGITTITYTLPSGCKATSIETVNPLPAAITGTKSVCEGSTTTLNNATAGGTWNSSNPATATVSSGAVLGVAPGVDDISYTLSTGCRAITTVTVNPLPNPAITVTGFTLSTSTGYANYQWMLGGVAITGAT